MENQITTFFSEKIAACQAAVTALNADHRADEAVFEKIRMNVYDIFRQVNQAAAQVSGGDEAKRREFLLHRLENIPASWKTAYDTAAQHGNTGRMHIEQLKLDTVEEIKQKVLEWSEAQ